MLTFEKVLAVFQDYLAQDTRYEVLMTSRGYTVLEWDSVQLDWNDAQFCPTPEKMKKVLLDAFAGYLEFTATQCSRALTADEQRNIDLQLQTVSNAL